MMWKSKTTKLLLSTIPLEDDIEDEDDNGERPCCSYYCCCCCRGEGGDWLPIIHSEEDDVLMLVR